MKSALTQHRLRLIVWFALAFTAWMVLSLTGCAVGESIQVVIEDTQRRPLGGALLYYEVSHRFKVYEFGFAIAGAKGEVPATGAEPVVVAWRFRTKIRFAAFAPGCLPTVRMDPPGKVEPRGTTITLRRFDETELPFEDRVFALSFPFEDIPELRARLEQRQYALLLQAFREAYTPWIDGKMQVLPDEQRKIDVLLRLIQNIRDK